MSVQETSKASNMNPEASQGFQNEPTGVPEASRRRPRVSKKRPGGVQGVQNEPKSVPEASRRRPRVSKKRPRGAKVDLLVFYSSTWEPRGIPEASGASKMSPEASQRCPEGAQECQRSVQEAQSSIYSCFIAFSSDPSPPGGIRRGAVITYRLGRLTEQ